MTHPEHTAASSDERRPLVPDLSKLEERSVRAWTEAMAVTPLGAGRYAVESESDARYLVDLPRGRCSCPDHGIRGERCKHLRRVAIEVNERRVPPPGAREGRCGGCGRTTFLPEEGPSICGDCWLEPGDVATDRETGETLVVQRLTDEHADERIVEATGRTVADHPTNDGYPSDDPVVEVVYPFSGSPEQRLEELPRYAFPYSRLAVRDQMLLD